MTRLPRSLGFAVIGLAATGVAALLRRRRPTTHHLTATTTVNKDPHAVYEFWRDVETFPTFTAHLRSVTADGPLRSHWVADAPAGRTVEWDAEVVRDSPGRLIEWRSTPDATVRNTGRVTFTPAPGGRGTEVRVEIDYEIPGGRLGEVVSRLFGENPAQQVRDDLRRAKQVIETGDVVRSAGSPAGTKARQQVAQHPAQPVPANA